MGDTEEHGAVDPANQPTSKPRKPRAAAFKSPALANAAANAAKASAEYQRLAELHSLLGIEPEVGSVLQFEHTYANRAGGFSKPYTYVALRTEAGWCMSSTRAAGRIWTWDQIVEFIDDEECFIATQWEQIGAS